MTEERKKMKWDMRSEDVRDNRNNDGMGSREGRGRHVKGWSGSINERERKVDGEKVGEKGSI